MKNLFLILFIAFTGLAKSQCVFIYVSEKVHGAEIPVTHTEFEVYVNDTLKKKTVSKNDGSVGRVSLEPGTYRVRVTSPEFEAVVKENVVVNESKTTDLMVTLVRIGAVREEEKKGKK